jgi:hypothetical protein
MTERIDLPAAPVLVPSAPAQTTPARPRRLALLPERSDFLAGDTEAKVEAFLAQALVSQTLPDVTSAPESAAQALVPQALVPWICDVLLSNHSIKAYGRDLVHFVRQMQAQGIDALQVTGDHVKLYKRALLEAGMERTTALGVARRL